MCIGSMQTLHIFQKGLDNLWILVSTEVLEPAPSRYQGTTVQHNGNHEGSGNLDKTV